MVQKNEVKDVVIVGAGPAGCATAICLNNIDPSFASRFAVLEKRSHPRDKICAGGINGRAWQLIEDIGFRVRVPSVVVGRALIKTGVGVRLHDATDMTRITRRDLFDAELARNLPERGIDLREGECVKKIKRAGKEFDVETSSGTIRAKCVIGADGVSSIVRRSLFDAKESSHLVGMATCPARGHFAHSEKAIVLDFGNVTSGGGGYRWVFPFLNEGEEWINTGICDWRDRSAKELKKGIAKYLESMDMDPTGATYKFYRERPFNPRNPFCGPGVLLAGDAAGVDPFFGEGISYGLEYGILAANAIADALVKKDYSFDTYMRALKKSRLGKELMVAWLASKFYYGKFHNLLTRAAFADEHTFNYMGEILAGRLRPSKKLAVTMSLHIVKNFFRL